MSLLLQAIERIQGKKIESLSTSLPPSNAPQPVHQEKKVRIDGWVKIPRRTLAVWGFLTLGAVGGVAASMGLAGSGLGGLESGVKTRTPLENAPVAAPAPASMNTIVASKPPEIPAVAPPGPEKALEQHRVHDTADQSIGEKKAKEPKSVQWVREADAAPMVIETQGGKARAVTEDALFKQAESAWQIGDSAKAESLLLKSLSKQQDHAAAWHLLAKLQFDKGLAVQARLTLEKALALDPIDPLIQQTRVMMDASNNPQNEGALLQWIEREPRNPEFRASLGRLYGQQKRWQQAQENYAIALNLAPQNPEYAFNTAVALDHLGQYSPALQHYLLTAELLDRTPAAAVSVEALQKRVNNLQRFLGEQRQ